MTANEHYNFLSDIADDFPGTDEDFTGADLDRIRGIVGTIPTPTDTAISVDPEAAYDDEIDGWINGEESAAAYDGFDTFVAVISQ